MKHTSAHIVYSYQDEIVEMDYITEENIRLSNIKQTIGWDNYDSRVVYYTKDKETINLLFNKQDILYV